MDELLALAIPLAFASIVTAHVALIGGLVARGLRLHALIALVAFPLAPWWGARAGMRVRAGAWTASAIAYLALRIAARR